jgi:2-dehydro-3-deoxyphosphogluconate aldolase / (4S)-4-hydroxy-2-oxoglutarate aldolase
MNLAQYLADVRIIPVVEADTVSHAVPLGRALADAGFTCVEITFRTAAATDSIAAISADVPELTIGAGTVRTVEQARSAVQAGADFLVAPGLNPAIVSEAQALGVPMLPGVCTPTEIEQALGLGLTLLKFFPAEPSGGTVCLSALAGPYPDVMFVPTGGIGPANLSAYLALPTVAACGGSWMAPRSLIARGDFASIAVLAAEALELADRAAGELRGERDATGERNATADRSPA